MTPNYVAPIPFLPSALCTRLTESGVAAPPIIICSEAKGHLCIHCCQVERTLRGRGCAKSTNFLVAPCLKLERCHFLAAVNLTFKRFYDTPNRYDSFDSRRMGVVVC